MCLGIPMEIESISGLVARCNANGVRRDVSLALLGEGSATIGDFVMVHVGYAIQKVAPAFARSAWETTDEMNRGTLGHDEV